MELESALSQSRTVVTDKDRELVALRPQLQRKEFEVIGLQVTVYPAVELP